MWNNIPYTWFHYDNFVDFEEYKSTERRIHLRYESHNFIKYLLPISKNVR